MHKIPEEILKLFMRVDSSTDSSAEERLLTWLLENKVEELDCYQLHAYICGFRCIVPPSQIVKIAKVIAESSVHTVNFSNNFLGEYGPAVAANLTQQHSKIVGVNFRANNLQEYGPLVAANLTGKHSKVQVVNFSWNDLGSYGPLVAANLTGEYSNVQVVNFSENGFCLNGPLIAANLTGKHSKVRVVDFSFNHFSSYGPGVVANLTRKHSKIEIVNFSGNRLSPYDSLTAANLTGEHSKVHTVDFSHNGCAKNDPAIIKKLTGTYSKIINIKGIELTVQQLKENAVNLLMQSEELSKDSLGGLAFRTQYEALKKSLNDKLLPLSHCITLLSLFPKSTKGSSVLIKALLLHEDALTLADISSDKTDEVVKDYINDVVKRYMSEVMQKYIAENCRKRDSDLPVEEIARALSFTKKKRKNNELEQALPNAADQEIIEIAEQTASTPKKHKQSN